ncbi:MAG: flagellar motor switch protein FliN [Balneolaceae bacterium]
MENWKETFQKYLLEIEKFLTSVLLEETHIHSKSADPIAQDALIEDVQKKDVFIFSTDETSKSDVIILLDEEWFGLLSSIMLGVEEKSNNDITRDLLMKFATDMSASLEPVLNNDGIEFKLSNISIFTQNQLIKELNHTEYFQMKLEVEGLADDNVRAELLIGNPEKRIQKETEELPEAEMDSNNPEMNASEKDGESTDDIDIRTENDSFKETDARDMEDVGAKEMVISAKHAEFDEFTDQATPKLNGNNGDSRSMDVLRDVKMDVSVELGRIELPLGKVLQLAKGSVIELEKLAGEPVDILVNGLCIAKGEVVVIDEHFGVRIASLVTTRQRIASLN